MAYGKEGMQTSVARFEDLKPIDYASFIKNYKPDGTQGYALIGRAGKTSPAIKGNHGFTMAINKVSPEKEPRCIAIRNPRCLWCCPAPAPFSGEQGRK